MSLVPKLTGLFHAQLESLLETIPSGIVIVEGPQGRVTYTNERARSLYGRDARGLDIKGHARVLKLMHPDRTPFEPEELPASRALIHGETVRNEEILILQPGGVEISVLASAAPIYDTNFEIVAAIGVFDDISERRRMENALRRLLEMQEEERKSITRELHDETGQSLTFLGMLLDKVVRSFPNVELADLREAQALVKDISAEVRDLSMSLRPAMLDDLGLLPTLIWCFQDYKKRTGIEVEFRHANLPGNLAPEVTIAAYRIIQEGLTNIARHAGATRAVVYLYDDGTTLCLRIADRGRGFDPKSVPAVSSGLRGIRERACSLGGTVALRTSPGSGTVLEVKLPAGMQSSC